MDCRDTLNLIAIIIAPVAAVLIGQWLQNRANKRKDKMEIFKTLMISRSVWSLDSVKALNIIDIVFAGDKTVREKWKYYYDKLCVENPSETELKKIKTAQEELLESMADSLGYKGKITWKTIQNPYVPKGMIDAEKKQQEYQNGQLDLAKLAGMLRMMVESNPKAAVKAFVPGNPEGDKANSQ